MQHVGSFDMCGCVIVSLAAFAAENLIQEQTCKEQSTHGSHKGGKKTAALSIGLCRVGLSTQPDTPAGASVQHTGPGMATQAGAAADLDRQAVSSRGCGINP